MDKYLLSIDIGSSICKIVLFDERFQVKAKTSTEINTYHPKPLWGQQEPVDPNRQGLLLRGRLRKGVGEDPASTQAGRWQKGIDAGGGPHSTGCVRPTSPSDGSHGP